MLWPGEDIIQYAKENNVDQIVVGIKRKSKLGKFIFWVNCTVCDSGSSVSGSYSRVDTHLREEGTNLKIVRISLAGCKEN